MLEPCMVRLSDSEIVIYLPGCQEIKRYPIPGKGSRERYIGRTNPGSHTKVSLNLSELTSRLEVFGPEMKVYIEQLKRHKPGSYAHHLRKILSMKVNYHVDDIMI